MNLCDIEEKRKNVNHKRDFLVSSVFHFPYGSATAVGICIKKVNELCVCVCVCVCAPVIRVTGPHEG